METFTLGLLHFLTDTFFKLLIVCLFARIVLSWLQLILPVLSPTNRFVRIVYNLTDPMIEPVAKRLPRLSIGMLDLGYLVAFLFAFWSLQLVDSLIQAALPG